MLRCRTCFGDFKYPQKNFAGVDGFERIQHLPSREVLSVLPTSAPPALDDPWFLTHPEKHQHHHHLPHITTQQPALIGAYHPQDGGICASPDLWHDLRDHEQVGIPRKSSTGYSGDILIATRYTDLQPVGMGAFGLVW